MARYSDIIDTAISVLGSILESEKLTCITTEIAVSTGDDSGTTVYEKNDGYKVIDTCKNNLEKLKTSINALLVKLFTDMNVDDGEEPYEGDNFLAINAYADGSKSFELYNRTTEEFEKKADYWFVRGHLYEMIPKLMLGDYLNMNIGEYAGIKAYCNSIKTYCGNVQTEYEDWIETNTTMDSEGNTTTPSVSEFWTNKELDKLETACYYLYDITKYFVYITISNIDTLITNYMTLYETASSVISSGENFISAQTKTSTDAGLCLGDVFDAIGQENFNMLCEPIGVAYSKFKEAEKIRDESHYADIDDSNMYLRKILLSYCLEEIDFFNTAKTYLNTIVTYRNTLKI